MGYRYGSVVLLLICLPVLVMISCGRQEPAGDTSNDSARPVVMASLYPLADLSSQLLGDIAQVETLIPPGVSPHGFELRAEELAKLSRAKVLVLSGGVIDLWVEEALSRFGGAYRVVVFSDLVGIELPAGGHHGHHHDHHHHDGHHHEDHDDHGDDAGRVGIETNPHLWLDPVLTIEFIEALGPLFAEAFSDHRALIESRSSALIRSLREVDDTCRRRLGDLEQKKLMTFHNAFDRFADRYGLDVVQHLIPIDLLPGGEVKPGDLVDAINAIRRYELGVIYAEPQFPDVAAAGLSRETGVAVYRLDPLGHPGVEGYRTYQEMILSNVDVLVSGQQHSQADGT